MNFNERDPKKNAFFSSTYNRKVKITYDRLKIILQENKDRLCDSEDYGEHIVSIIMAIITSLTNWFVDEIPMEVKSIITALCAICVFYFIKKIKNTYQKNKERITVDALLFEIETDNELDENNKQKK